jgi:hypothetical protein
VIELDLTELRAPSGGPPDAAERLNELQAATVKALPSTIQLAGQVFTRDKPPSVWYRANVHPPGSSAPVVIMLTNQADKARSAAKI